MIFRDSRYASGVITKEYNPATGQFPVVVYRKFPNAISKFFIYEWTEEDRIDQVALRFLGNASLWWKIMDFNPELLNPMHIPSGSPVRIPNG